MIFNRILAWCAMERDYYLLLRRTSTDWYILFMQEVRKSVTLVGLDISHMSAHMRLTCDSPITLHLPLSLSPLPCYPPLSLVLFEQHKIKDVG